MHGLILGRDRKTTPYSMQKENSLSKPPWYSFQPLPRPNQRSSCCSFSLHLTVTAAKSTITLLSIFPSFDRHHGQINDQVVVHFPFIRPSPRPNQRSSCCPFSLHSTVTTAKPTSEKVLIFLCIYFFPFLPNYLMQKECSLSKLYARSPLTSPSEKTVKNLLPTGISPQGDFSHTSLYYAESSSKGEITRPPLILRRKKIHYQSHLHTPFNRHHDQINNQVIHFAFIHPSPRPNQRSTLPFQVGITY